VSSQPTGADVYVDNQLKGQSDILVGSLRPGQHTVALTLDGYQCYETTVSVAAGERVAVNATLQQLTGSIRVTSDPTGADVYIGGSYSGRAEIEVGPLAVGQHRVALTLEGYQPYETTVSVTTGETVELNATMQRQAGSISISSPPAADVYVNEAYVGYTSASLGSLPPGRYRVRILLEGYVPHETMVMIEGGENEGLDPTLQPANSP